MKDDPFVEQSHMKICFRIRRAITRTLVLFSIMLLPNLSHAETYKFSAIENHVYTATIGELLEKAFKKAGHELIIHYLPPKRAITMADRGKYDGEVGRVANITDDYPNLVAIPEPVGLFRAVAFSNTPGETFSSWEQFKPHKIGTIRGIFWSNSRTEAGYKRTVLKGYQDLIKLVEVGRLKYGLGQKMLIEHYAAEAGVEAHILQPPIFELETFAFVHKKNKHLIQPIATAIREMKEAGAFDILFR